METLKNYGVINSQQFIEEFVWNEKNFFSYLISFNEFEGYFKIVREAKHEQALIGAHMIFDYSEFEERIVKYRIVGFTDMENKEDRIKRLMIERNKKEQQNGKTRMAKGKRQ
jgi:hypothetical protein